MNESLPYSAWLEGATTPPVPVRGTCYLGRSKTNNVVLADPKASRRHAIIHVQEGGQFWLVDFGSVNGTSINHRRIMHPTALHDQDQICIADICLTFRVERTHRTRRAATVATAATIPEIKTVPCWLLLADLEGSTRLSQDHAQEELPILIGQWFSACKNTIDECGGQINKFLGDGFFAYWTESSSTSVSAKVGRAVEKLSEEQKAASLGFRWVLHYGPVSTGGATSMGEESLLGPEVNFAFRMEKLAGKLKLLRLISDAAHQRLPLTSTVREAGRHALDGFDGKHPFLTF